MFLVNKILKKNKGENVLLKDPETKYEVKLIEKEVRTIFHSLFQVFDFGTHSNPD